MSEIQETIKRIQNKRSGGADADLADQSDSPQHSISQVPNNEADQSLRSLLIKCDKSSLEFNASQIDLSGQPIMMSNQKSSRFLEASPSRIGGQMLMNQQLMNYKLSDESSKNNSL